ncbi:gap junction delta-3 protein-like [Chanos chanos]|uniref:Gap junction delta-3 protein-like n=1 Tax=Chanos chanos TaxID=29144 RepID=A0A6J2VGC3_CHACN|nr:gap junction delta-3 protein [Chanos chanos]
MAEWAFLSGLFGTLQAHSPMLGRFWLLLMLVFRMLILGTVASDLFEDEQEEFVCNTLQPGCKQVCYDEAFPISQYRFWVFHIVLISTPSLLFVVYTMHHHNKRKVLSRSLGTTYSSVLESKQEQHLKRLYLINVGFRLLAEVGFVVGQWWLYGFRVEAQYPCSRYPCPYTVDCFTSRPMEKTVLLCFYFAVGVLSAFSSFAELIHVSCKAGQMRDSAFWDSSETNEGSEKGYYSQNLQNLAQEETGEQAKAKEALSVSGVSGRIKGSSMRSSSIKKYPSNGRRSFKGYYGQKSNSLMV